MPPLKITRFTYKLTKELSCYFVEKANCRTIIPFIEKNNFIRTYREREETGRHKPDVYRESLAVYTLTCLSGCL